MVFTTVKNTAPVKYNDLVDDAATGIYPLKNLNDFKNNKIDDFFNNHAGKKSLLLLNKQGLLLEANFLNQIQQNLRGYDLRFGFAIKKAELRKKFDVSTMPELPCPGYQIVNENDDSAKKIYIESVVKYFIADHFQKSQLENMKREEEMVFSKVLPSSHNVSVLKDSSRCAFLWGFPLESYDGEIVYQLAWVWCDAKLEKEERAIVHFLLYSWLMATQQDEIRSAVDSFNMRSWSACLKYGCRVDSVRISKISDQ